MKTTHTQQMILARDLIDQALQDWHNVDAIESISDYFFSLSMIIPELDTETPVAWADVFAMLDTRYVQLRAGQPPADAILFENLKTISETLQHAIEVQNT